MKHAIDASYFLFTGFFLIVPVFKAPLLDSVLEHFSLSFRCNIGMLDFPSQATDTFTTFPLATASTLCTISVFSGYEEMGGLSISPEGSSLRLENDGILVIFGFSFRGGFSLCSASLSLSML